MRADHKVVRIFGSIAAATLAASLVMTGPAQGAPTEPAVEWKPALLSSEQLFQGSVVRLRYEDGVTVVASAGAKVVFSGSVEQAPDRTGEQRTVKRSVRVIDPLGSRRPAPDAVQNYRAAGRSVYAEALAAGYSPAAARSMTQQGGATLDAEPPIYASGCVYSEEVQPDPEFEWSGCYKLYDVQAQDADAWYVAGSGTARGWGTNALRGGKELNAGYSEIFWNAFEGEIIEAAPSANRDGDNCRQFTISLARIIELSYQVPLCDDRWAVTWDQWHHRVQWEGASIGGSSDLRSASGASTLRVPSYVDTIGMEYQVGWAYRCFC